MRIAIMGSGGLGGYFGALLARAGEDVTFIARGEHLQAIRQHGLRVESLHYESFTVAPAQATDDPGSAGPMDLVICATKTYQLEAALAAMRPLVGPGTTVLPLQNGVDAADRLAAELGPEPVMGGVCYVASAVAAPGLIRQQSQFRRIVLGELDGRESPRGEAIAAAIRHSGAGAEVTRDIRKELWTKFLFIAAFSGVGSVTRVPVGEIMGCSASRSLMEQAMRETENVARAQGLRLEPDIVPSTMKFCDDANPQLTSSMQRDVMAGKLFELEAHNGYLARLGRRFGIPTPVHEFIYAALLPQLQRAQAGAH